MSLHSDDHHLPRLVWYPVPKLSDSGLRETALNFSDSELRETGYEFLTFTWLFSRIALKESLGFKTTSSLRSEGEGGSGISQKPAGPFMELMRKQMRIPEAIDLRLAEPLQKIAHDLHGRCMESIVLPLELIERYSQSDFPSQQEYEACLRRNFKVLEEGLLLHPHFPLDKAGTLERREWMRKHGICLRRMIDKALENPIVFQRNSESMQMFRVTVMCLASRSSDGAASETCHWADGYPLNLYIYQTLLDACFDIHEKTCVIEDLGVVLEFLKKTWVVLAINQMLHNICFSWVLFHRYLTTGQVENSLLLASSKLLEEVEKDTNNKKDPIYSTTLNSALSLILGWADKRLVAYHDAFDEHKIESLEGIVSLAVLSALILAECRPERKEADETGTTAKNCIRSYIRSSLGRAFAQKLEELNPSKHPFRKQNGGFRFLSVLAGYTSELAFKEKKIFSPKLKRWHPVAAGVAAATLHKLYGKEWKNHIKRLERITELTRDAIEVLLAAGELEKVLVQIAEDDSNDSGDDGKFVVTEIQLYNAKNLLTKLVESWINIKVDHMGECVATNLPQEVWNLPANEEGFIPSAVGILKYIKVIVEEFFLLGIPMHADLLPKWMSELMSGLDKSLKQYILKATSGCGNRNTYIPTKHALTSASPGSKSHGAFQGKLQSAPRRKAPDGTRSANNLLDMPGMNVHVGTTGADNSFDINQLCARINTMQHIRMMLEVLENMILDTSEVRLKFKLSSAAAVEGIHQLCDCIAYKVVFQDLRHVFWDGLYVRELAFFTRIGPYLEELKKYLAIISSTSVPDEAKTRIITEVMQASFDGFLLVLLAGGPSRSFSRQDYDIIEEDFNSLMKLFGSNGSITKRSTTVRGVLPLFGADTDDIIEQLNELNSVMYSSSAKSRLPLPPTSDLWSPEEQETLLRVLFYRNDKAASKFLKKKYNLTKKV